MKKPTKYMLKKKLGILEIFESYLDEVVFNKNSNEYIFHGEYNESVFHKKTFKMDDEFSKINTNPMFNNDKKLSKTFFELDELLNFKFRIINSKYSK